MSLIPLFISLQSLRLKIELVVMQEVTGTWRGRRLAGLLALPLDSTDAAGDLTFRPIILLLNAWESGKGPGVTLDLRFRPSLSGLYVVAEDVCRLQKLSETLSGIECLSKVDFAPQGKECCLWSGGTSVKRTQTIRCRQKTVLALRET